MTMGNSPPSRPSHQRRMASYPTNDEIAKQQQYIEETEVNVVPVVSDRLPFALLKNEYGDGNIVFVEKLLVLKAFRHSEM